jgi:hypothetical protein
MTRRRAYQQINLTLLRGFVAVAIAAVLLVIIWMITQ